MEEAMNLWREWRGEWPQKYPPPHNGVILMLRIIAAIQPMKGINR